MKLPETHQQDGGLPLSTSDLFCLFAGGFYYPEGGASDFRGVGTVDELKASYAANNEKWAYDNGSSPWGHICEHATMKIVMEAEHRLDGIHWQNAEHSNSHPDKI
jgi:hypothetical protein